MPSEPYMITNEDVTAKVSAQASLGVVSALLAGFSQTALVEIEVTPAIASKCLIFTASVTLGLSTLVMLESTLEYMFVMRELSHGTFCAWSLMEALSLPRRIAEACFVIALLNSIISTACMLHIRFVDLHSAVTIVAISARYTTHFSHPSHCVVSPASHARRSCSQSSSLGCWCSCFSCRASRTGVAHGGFTVASVRKPRGGARPRAPPYMPPYMIVALGWPVAEGM